MKRFTNRHRKLMQVTAPHFCAGAVWERRAPDSTEPVTWVCIQAAPIMRWMVGKTLARVWAGLLCKGYGLEWLPDHGHINAGEFCDRVAQTNESRL